MTVKSETLDKYLAEVRRIAESREKGAEHKILKIYRELSEDLNGYLGNIYAKYADEDDRLTRAQLMLKGEYARFLEEVNNKLDGIPDKVKEQVSTLINEMILPPTVGPCEKNSVNSSSPMV